MTEAVLSTPRERTLLHLVKQPLLFSITDLETQFKPDNFKSFPLEKGEKRALCNPFTGAVYLKPDKYDKWQECPTIETAIQGIQSVIDTNPKTTTHYTGLLDLLYVSRDTQRYTLENTLKELNKFTEESKDLIDIHRGQVENKIMYLKKTLATLLDPAIMKTNPYRRAGLLSRAILFGVEKEDYKKRVIEKLTANEELFQVINSQKGIDDEFHEDVWNFQTDRLKIMLFDRIEASQVLMTNALEEGAKSIPERNIIPDTVPES